MERSSTRKQILNSQFHQLVALHFLRERTVKFYADLLSVTPKYLTQVTKEMTGKPAGVLIDDRVIREAKVLLRDPGVAVKDVADALNFSDPFFFSKYFKNFTRI